MQECGQFIIALFVLNRIKINAGMRKSVVSALSFQSSHRDTQSKEWIGKAIVASIIRTTVIITCCCLTLPFIEGLQDHLLSQEMDLQATIEELTSAPSMSTNTPSSIHPSSSYLLPFGLSRKYQMLCKALALFSLIVLTPIWEEIFFRAFLMNTIVQMLMSNVRERLTQKTEEKNSHNRKGLTETEAPHLPLPFAISGSVIFTSFIFSALHVDDSLSSFLTHFLVGIVFGASYALSCFINGVYREEKYDTNSDMGIPNVVAPIVIHALWNMRCAAYELVIAS